MPELPEAETVARELSDAIVGRRIVEVTVREPRGINRPPAEFKASIVGRRVERVQRRAKAVVLSLDGDGALWLHMGLRSVVGLVARNSLPPNPFLGLIFDDGRAFFMDKTFMGKAHILDPEDLSRRWNELGVEPLGDEFTVEKLSATLAARAGQSVKAILMDQAAIAGIGNIFSDEILHAASLYPARKAASLVENEIKRLHGAIRTVLLKAVDAGGGPEWVAMSGKESGYKADVHGQTTCATHGEAVEKVSFGGRTAYVCRRQARPV